MKTLQQLGTDLGALLEEKNAAYGSSFSKSGGFLKLLWPNGIPAARYDDALLLARIFDKQMRIATDNDAFGESPYQDIAGYGLLGTQLHQHRKDSATCPGSASGPNASSSSKAQHDSAPQPTSAKTTTSASVRPANEPSQQPVSSSAASVTAGAPTAMEDAGVGAEDRNRTSERRCSHMIGNTRLRVPGLGYCSICVPTATADASVGAEDLRRLNRNNAGKCAREACGCALLSHGGPWSASGESFQYCCDKCLEIDWMVRHNHE